MDQKVKVPAIAIDLDGVIWHQGRFIPGSSETLCMMAKNLDEIDEQRFPGISTKMPFLFVTNSGATTEDITADQMNEKLGLKDKQQSNVLLRQTISSDHFILNFTPLREDLKQFSDKLVLISGFEKTKEIMTSLGIKYYITMEEFAKIYPQLVPNNRFTMVEKEQTEQILQDRIPGINLEPFVQIHAVILSYISNHVEIVAQILCDVLSTSDGRIADEIPFQAPDSHVPVYSIANDYFFPSKECKLIRLGWGMYMDSIEMIYKKQYKKELGTIRCGKPEQITFKYAEKKAIEFAAEKQMSVSKFYMIGDNPHTDIKGAKSLGWETILVRTGVYQGQQIDEVSETPTIVVNNFQDAIQYIFEQENIKCPVS